MTTRYCRCGHHRSIHEGPHTECRAVRRAGKNAVGVWQHEFCDCKSYRPTEVGFWRGLYTRTEEWKSS